MSIQNKTNIAIAIDQDQKQALKAHLNEQGATISALMRRLITQYMEQHNVKPQ